MPWRKKDELEVIEYEVSPPAQLVDIQHDLGRRPVVKFFDRDGDQVEVSVEHLDENNVRVTTVNFMDGHILII